MVNNRVTNSSKVARANLTSRVVSKVANSSVESKRPGNSPGLSSFGERSASADAFRVRHPEDWQRLACRAR